MQADLNRNSPARRFLFSVAGGYGHFHPLVPLARALKQAGHEVAFATGASLRPAVEAAGFAHFRVGGNMAGDPEYDEVMAQFRSMPPGLDAELFIYSRLWSGITPRLRTPQLVEIAREWQPDMLIRESAEYGAAIAAEHLGLPHATVAVLASLKAQEVFEQGIAERLDPVRRDWGLAPDPDLTALYSYLFLVYSPSTLSMQGVSGAIPATTHFIRPEVFDNADNETLPDWMADLPQTGGPTVYAAMDTDIDNEPGMYPFVLQTIIEGVRDLPVNLIVTLGRDKDPADFGPQPANVRIEPYIPQSLLLPRCGLMIMHGGSNSLLAALDTGVPTVVVPLIADQFFNADVVRSLRLGEAVQLGSPGHPGVLGLERLTPSAVRSAAEQVLGDPVYRQNAGRLQAEMHALPSQEYAVELVERVAAEREPLLNPKLTITP